MDQFKTEGKQPASYGWQNQNSFNQKSLIVIRFAAFISIQEGHKMEYDLVFEGGGAKGLAFVGALMAFEKRGHTPRRVIGTSAGSILAVLVAAGYNSEESLAAIAERLPDGRSRFSSFLETPTIDEDSPLQDDLRYWLITELDNPAIPDLIEPAVDTMVKKLVGMETMRHLISLFVWGGWYSGQGFMSWLQEKLDTYGRNLSGTTLTEFNEKTGRDLSVVASDITGKEMLVLNHRTAPTLPTIWAVRMSMGCPFAWPEVIWKAEWGTYRGRDLSGHRVVDGGLLSNFPIKLLLSSDEYIDEIMGQNSAADNVIGFLIDEFLPVPGVAEQPKSDSTFQAVFDRSEIAQEMIWRIRGLADTILSAHDKFINEKDQQHVCRLPAKGYGTLEFDMPRERMELILAAGEAAMHAYFDNLVSPA
jgi:predicted acylesterase/phospholipase RssA